MRKLEQVISAQPMQDGDGVNIHRLGGRRLQQLINPFLMIDEINSHDAADYIGGFPEHPHRGFETVTYMKAGRMRHRDHMGNEGLIGAGDVQWLTAGAGVLHSEMPEQDQDLLHGFQIWLNLPAAEKMKPAAYQDIIAASINEQRLATGGKVRVIAGDVTINKVLVQGQITAAYTQPVLLDVQLLPNETVALLFNAEYSANTYIYKGKTDLLAEREMGIYGRGESLQVTAGTSGAELLVLSGRPIYETIAQYGPFVMNTMAEVEQALKDFRSQDYLEMLKTF